MTQTWSKRGLGLFAAPVDWVELMAQRPAALVVIDPYHLPPYASNGLYYLWRPWVGGHVLRQLAPAEYMARITAEWSAKGRPHFDGLQFLNEPNLAEESGYPTGSYAAAQATNAWAREVVPLLRAAFPQAEMHTPPLSTHANDLAFWDWLRPTVTACDVLNVHCYLDDPHRYRRVRALYPGLPLVISECGRGGGGTAEYGRELNAYFAGLDSSVEWAAPFVWQVVPEFAAWGLAGTAAARVLAEAAE